EGPGGRLRRPDGVRIRRPDASDAAHLRDGPARAKAEISGDGACSGRRGVAPGPRPVRYSLAAALLRDLPLQQGTDLGLAVAPMPAEGTDCAELARFGPPGHGLRVNAEHGCNFCRGQQGLWFLRARRHRYIPPQLPDLPRGCGRPPIYAPTAGVAGRMRVSMVRLVPDVRHGPNG